MTFFHMVEPLRAFCIINYFQIIENIVETFNGESIEKSSEYSGFQKFLIGCLESLDIDVTQFIGEFVHDTWKLSQNFIVSGSLKLERVKQLGEIARGTDPNSGIYDVISDTIIAIGGLIYNSLF